MRRRGEQGEGKLSAILWLAVFAAVGYAIFHVGPVYYDHYNLVDKMNELARSPRYSHPDDRIYDLLVKYVRENRLDAWVRRNSFNVSTVETGRRITVDYSREVEVLPGWKHTFAFNKQVEQPLIY